MNAVDNSSAAPDDWRARGRELWKARTRSERRGLLAAGTALALLFAWWVLVQPAWRTASAAPAQIDRLDAQLQQMQRIAAEAETLRGAAPLGAAQAGAALRGATERLGDKGKLTLQGDRATLTLNGASAEALRGWLVEARSAARARPVEAQLTRGAQAYSGTLVVQLGVAP